MAKDEKLPCSWVAPKWTPIIAATNLVKSPMGMDLIPFYGAAQGSDNSKRFGTVVFRQKWLITLVCEQEKVV